MTRPDEPELPFSARDILRESRIVELKWLAEDVSAGERKLRRSWLKAVAVSMRREREAKRNRRLG
jgi:hypothetical protein